MTSLSYSTMNALINEPHTYLCKMMDLKTRIMPAMEDGKKAHRVIQESVSGKTPNKLLENLPKFSVVETIEKDPKTKVTFPISDKYFFNGYYDGANPETGDLLEIKTGVRWSVGDFARLVQWKLYALGMPEYKNMWFFNSPRNPEEWNAGNTRIYNIEITEDHKKQARDFIDKAIYIIEHIKDYPLKTEKFSRWCNYVGCPYCPKS